ncbi:MAG: hypothetical protein K1X88_29945 [Nannocystaceae bacterium]|nr:hypothetical protein [Nannocystaceae bacterium]
MSHPAPSLAPTLLLAVGAIASVFAAVSGGIAGHLDVTVASSVAAVLMIVAALQRRHASTAAR